MLPLAKNIKRYFSLKEVVIVFVAIMVSITTGVGIFSYLKSDVVINDSGKQIVVKTMKTTVKGVLEQNGINVSSDDYISAPLEAKLRKNGENIIIVDRAVPVNVFVNGQQKTLMTYKDTVKEALDSSLYRLEGEDRLEGVSSDAKVEKDMNIKIVRVRREVVNEEVTIPYKVLTRENNRLDKGIERVVREGKQGIHQKAFEVLKEDGREIKRNLIKEAIIASPIDKIIELGTVLNYKTARGETVRYKKVMNMRATAYTASFKDTGKHPDHPAFGITFTGIRARKGVIAVDPRVIPLGTKVYVEVAGNTPDYGFALAADTGGAIKGDLIDLYFDEQKTADTWGVKRVKVYILAE